MVSRTRTSTGSREQRGILAAPKLWHRRRPDGLPVQSHTCFPTVFYGLMRCEATRAEVHPLLHAASHSPDMLDEEMRVHGRRQLYAYDVLHVLEGISRPPCGGAGAAQRRAAHAAYRAGPALHR